MRPEDEPWLTVARYHFYARRFGWTKDQVDSHPQWMLDLYPEVDALWRETQRALDEAAAKAAQSQQPKRR